MTRFIPTCTAIFVLMFALLVPAIQVQACKGGSGHHGNHKKENKISQLSPEEQKIATEINAKYRPLVEKQKNLLAVKQDELQAIMSQEAFEAEKAKSLGQEINALHSKLMDLHLSKKIELREKGVAYSATCSGKKRRSGPCTVGADQKGAGCKKANQKQCAKPKPCKL